MEIEAIKMVRGTVGLENVEIVIPFVRTMEMANVNDAREKNGLKGTPRWSFPVTSSGRTSSWNTVTASPSGTTRAAA